MTLGLKLDSDIASVYILFNQSGEMKKPEQTDPQTQAQNDTTKRITCTQTWIV